MRTVVVSGAGGGLGDRLLARLDALPTVERVLVLGPPGRRPPASHSGKIELVVGAEDRDDELARRLEGAEAVVHLGSARPARRPSGRSGHSTPSPAENVAAVRRLLEASGTSVRALVVLSSATVYGAWPDNPVPLPESTPLRPNPGFAYAVERAEVERLVAEWRDERPGAAVAVLRPTIVLGGRDDWLAGVLGSNEVVRRSGRPVQFLHEDDLVDALELALISRLNGPYNVAPDGWVPGEAAKALAGGGVRLGLPAGLRRALTGWAWRMRLSDVPPEAAPYVLHPWVVANDRLRAAGWRPRYSNEEAFVAGRPGSWWKEMSPQRRQQLTLAVAAALLLAVAAGVIAVVRGKVRTPAAAR